MKLILPIVIVVFSLLAVVGWNLTQRTVLATPISQNNTSLTLLSKLHIAFADVQLLSEDDQKIQVKISNWQVTFGKTKDFDLQIRALQEVATRLRMDEDKSHTIDLRFNKLVIK